MSPTCVDVGVQEPRADAGPTQRRPRGWGTGPLTRRGFPRQRARRDAGLGSPGTARPSERLLRPEGGAAGPGSFPGRHACFLPLWFGGQHAVGQDGQTPEEP